MAEMAPAARGIPLTCDPGEMPDYEHCCFCGARTRMWYTPRDVAVCHGCADLRTVDEVPTKKEWCASPQARGVRGATRDRDGSGEAGQTAKQAGPKATARAEGIAQAQSGGDNG